MHILNRFISNILSQIFLLKIITNIEKSKVKLCFKTMSFAFDVTILYYLVQI